MYPKKPYCILLQIHLLLSKIVLVLCTHGSIYTFGKIEIICIYLFIAVRIMTIFLLNNCTRCFYQTIFFCINLVHNLCMKYNL